MTRFTFRSDVIVAGLVVAGSAALVMAAAQGSDRQRSVRDRSTSADVVGPQTQGGGPDSDGDGVADVIDPAPGNPLICGDFDNDTCDDCSVTGGPPAPANDGPDSDADGICDAAECPCNSDVNGDTVVDIIDVITVTECVRGGVMDPACDINCDGAQNECDLDAVLCAFNGMSNCCIQVCGACCINGTACVEASQTTCEDPPPFGAGGIFQGPATTCGTQNAAIFEEPGGQIFVHVIGPPVQCPAPIGPAPAAGCVLNQFIDAWVSPPAGQMCHNFGVPGSPPIPAGFFGPGSDPFIGTVCYQGEPLGTTPFGEFGMADTLIRRTMDPFDRCALPGLNPVNVPLEIVALNLVSVQPIIVTYNGGMNPEPWDGRVTLSQIPAPMGQLLAVKTHCNGGTYQSMLPVQPLFRFSRQAPPATVQLDTGVAGIPPVMLQQNQPAPWVTDVDPNLGYSGDVCSDFHPGIQEPGASTDCDCQNNGLHDQCEIEGGLPDTNVNGIPDECEPAACCLGAGGCVVANGLSCPGFPGTTNAPGTLCDDVQCGGQPCIDDTDCDDDDACTYDDCPPSNTCTNTAGALGDVNGVGGVDIFDILCVLDGFAGNFDTCAQSNMDLAPCPLGDGMIDIFDILAVLDGFAGEQGCCAP